MVHVTGSIARERKYDFKGLIELTEDGADPYLTIPEDAN